MRRQSNAMLCDNLYLVDNGCILVLQKPVTK